MSFFDIFEERSELNVFEVKVNQFQSIPTPQVVHLHLDTLLKNLLLPHLALLRLLSNLKRIATLFLFYSELAIELYRCKIRQTIHAIRATVQVV